MNHAQNKSVNGNERLGIVNINFDKHVWHYLLVYFLLLLSLLSLLHSYNVPGILNDVNQLLAMVIALQL